ncbi:MAG TPA: PaaI family thioesterase [Acidimicrobiales bacterium]|nr:PaaI family thioesterase [Acidimicrobiales bacterium]
MSAPGPGPTDGTPPVDSQLAAHLGQALEAVRATAGDPAVAAARQVGETLRRVIDRLTATSAPPEVLLEAAERLEQVRGLLQPFDTVRRYEGASEASGLAQDRAFFDWSPQLGLSNPLAPPIRVAVRDGAVVGTARFGIAYEGPPGCVHGGHIAAAFDEVLGLTQTLSGQVGMTGTLSVRYRRPTPLYSQLTFEGRVDTVSGRKVFTSGRLMAGEELTAEATGLFIAISPERFLAGADRRQPDRD